MADPVLIALGANIPGPDGRPALESCQWALEKLGAIPALTLHSVSAWYRTAPVPASDQPDFINGVARFSGEVQPHDLLHAMHEIEAEAGRLRSVQNAARTLDLDLIAIGDRIIDDPDLVLPHPRLAERAFVLFPLCDVAPEWIHPILRRSASALRRTLPPQRIHRMEP